MYFIYLAVLFLGIGQVIDATEQPNKLRRSVSAPAHLGQPRLTLAAHQPARASITQPIEQKTRVIAHLTENARVEAFALAGYLAHNPLGRQCLCVVCRSPKG